MIIDCILGGVVLYSNHIEVEAERKDKNESEMIALVDNSEIKLLTLSRPLQYDDITFLGLKNVSIATDNAIKEAEPAIVYDGMTLEQLAKKLNKSLKNELSGQGMLIASYSLKKGADPYIVTAIMLHETGCKWNCSRIMRECNNVGGKKGSGCGSYQYYDSLETGIKKLINYLAKNYFNKGLDTTKEINKKYASDKNWYKKINNYVKDIKAA